MSKLYKLYPLVESILNQSVASRNSDELLYLYVIKRLAATIGIYFDPCNLSLKNFIEFRRQYNLPTIETVGRVRRKVQEEHPSLSPCLQVSARKELLEEEFRSFATGRIS